MGDIYKKIDICGLTADGKKLRCVRNVSVLVDTGASSTVISERLSRRLGGSILKGMEHIIDARRVPLKLTAITLHAPKCHIRPTVVVVDNQLIARAGTTPAGEPVDVILGHDYMQRQHVGLRYLEQGGDLVCDAKELRGSRTSRAKKKRLHQKAK